MTTRSLILSPHEVRAALDGRLGLVVRPVAHKLAMCFDTPRGPKDVAAGYPYVEDEYGDAHKAVDLCPLGAPGTRLCCRETWKNKWGREFEYQERIADILYRADGEYHTADECPASGPWRSPATMPAWASRITLEVVTAGVMRLNNISNQDILLAGMRSESCNICPHVGGSGCSQCMIPARPFIDTWNARYAAKGLGWDSNCWVWKCEVRRVEV